MSARVSVIIPTYNRAEYLVRAIESVLRQTLAVSEVIVVDDESTDSTGERLRPYSSRITYIRQKNAGPAAARNRGIAAAKGDYIAFLDSDDLWLPEKNARQMELFRADPAVAVCHTAADLIDDRDAVVERLSDEPGFVQSGDVWRAMLLWKCRVLLSSLALKRECLREVGGFDESLCTGEDSHFIIRCARRYHFGYLPQRLLLRRAHRDSLTSQAYASPRNNTTFQSLQKVLDLYPEIDPVTRRRAYAVRYFHYGCVNFHRGEYVLARHFFRQAVRNAPLNVRARVFLITSFFPGLARFFKMHVASMGEAV